MSERYSVRPNQPGPPLGVRTVHKIKDDSTRIVLIRHGEAECNVNGIIGGVRGCTGLTKKGIEQVNLLARRIELTGELKGTSAIYSSVLLRAVQTAKIISASIARSCPDRELLDSDDGLLEIIQSCELCELHPGEADGLSWQEFSARYREPDWNVDPSTLLSPGGESWSGFIERAANAVTSIANSHRGEQVAIVCHAGVIEATMSTFLPVQSRSIRRGWIQSEHASITEWELSDGCWILRRFNDTTPKIDHY